MKRIADDFRLLVIDTETGGFDPEEYSIFSIGIVVWKPFKIVDKKEIFIAEPDIKYEEEAISVNKIDINLIRKNGLKPSAAINDLESFITKHFKSKDKMILSGHNIWFDIRFIERLYKIAGRNFRETFSYRLLDTSTLLLYLSTLKIIDVSKPSLDEAIKHFNIKPPIIRHSALHDALATADILTNLFQLNLCQKE